MFYAVRYDDMYRVMTEKHPLFHIMLCNLFCCDANLFLGQYLVIFLGQYFLQYFWHCVCTAQIRASANINKHGGEGFQAAKTKQGVPI